MVTKKTVADAVQRVAVGTYKRFLPVATMCGHRTKRKGKVSAFGETGVLETPCDAEQKPYICLECLAGMSIMCAYCQGVIFPFDSVTLYMPDQEFEAGVNTATYGKPLRYVACMRQTCLVEKKGFVFGVWLPNVVTRAAYVGSVIDDEKLFREAVKFSRHSSG